MNELINEQTNICYRQGPGAKDPLMRAVNPNLKVKLGLLEEMMPKFSLTE